jgi:gliding motility-associated-like protein
MVILGFPTILCAQKEANNWYFGINAGITFNSGSPVAVTNGQMTALEGCATMSSNDGKLLFYSDGQSVWDSTHTKTPNGNNTLNGSYNSTQAAIIIPRPDSSGQYYIFTTDLQGGIKGLCFSEFNMSLNSGKGDIVTATQNIQLLTSTCEKLTAVKHANGRDYWVLALHFGADTLYSYLISPSGLTKTVKTNTGLNLVQPWIGGTLGYMKVSPDGSKIAYSTCSKDTLIFADFNTSSGEVSNIWRTYINDGYGVEFSAKSNYLYVAEGVNFVINQFNAKAKTYTDFIASKVKLDSTKGTNSPLSGSLQLGPDGKIYTDWAYHYYLGVIHAPDSAGKACRPQQNYVYLKGKRTLYGLPGFITSYLNRNQQVQFTRNCLNDSTQFWLSVTKDIDSVKWNFGDSASRNMNIGRGIKNIYHVYRNTGTYTVKLVSFFKTYSDTTVIDIPIKSSKPFIGNDTMLCNSFSLELKPNRNYLSYQWSSGDAIKAISIKKPGTYILNVKDSLNCIGSDTIFVKNSTVSAGVSLSDTGMCENYNSFYFKNKSVFKQDSLESILWKLSDNTSYSDSVIIKSFKTVEDFTVKLVVTSINGCKDSVSKKIVIYPNSEIGFSINQSNQCFKGHNFIFKDTSKILGGKITSHFWNFGDGTTDSISTIFSKKYRRDSAYNVILVVATDKGCKDTISKIVTLHSNPESDFSINQYIQCFKYNSYDFKNLSTHGADSIVNYFWDFGDSKTANLRDITNKRYAKSDSFEVKLLAVSKYGCKDSITQKVYINPNTTVDFTINNPSQCFNQHDFNFNNSSTILNGTFNCKWELGDGDSLFTKDIVSKKYNKDSTYIVRLVTITDKGCKDTLSKLVLISPNPKANFSINSPSQCFKWNSFDYTNTSAIKMGSIAESNWNLGDGEIRVTKDVNAKSYTTSDSFLIDLLVVSEKGCRDSISKWIKIIEMESGFDILVDSNLCPVYTFSNTTKNYKKLKWNLSDLGLDEKGNTRYEKEFTHQFSQLGSFTPCLYVENNYGCLDTICKELKVEVSKKLNIPNVFTPGNNDKLNDVFDIETSGMEEYHLVIFNRWGQKLFDTEIDGIGDDGHNWRGRPDSVSALYPDGTYFYILNYKFKCESKSSQTYGIITLIGGKD